MEDDVKFAAAVTKGLASLDRGEFIGHEEVGKRTVGELARAILGRTAISGALGHWLPVAGSVISVSRLRAIGPIPAAAAGIGAKLDHKIERIWRAGADDDEYYVYAIAL